MNFSSISLVTVPFLLLFLGVKLTFQKPDRKEVLLFGVLCLLVVVNFIGVLGPETGFDALWYHLTFPKIYLQNQTITFLKGELFYYSLLPSLGEMLYASGLSFASDTGPKLIHFSFGVLTCLALYKLSREFLSSKWSILVVILFYSSLVVSWLSITAYIDLIRAFFETSAILFFVRYSKGKNFVDLIFSCLMLGFSISTKIISLVTLPIYIILLRKFPVKALLYGLLALLVPLPWFIVSFLSSGNPIYPFFSSSAPSQINFYNFLPDKVVLNLANVFLFSSDPISPLIVLLSPFLLLLLKNKKYKLLLNYAFISLILWYAATFSGIWHGTEKAGSSRFLTAYLPVYSILCVAGLHMVRDVGIKKLGAILILLIAVSTIIYRGIANYRFLPVILGQQTRESYLLKNLNFYYGDFFDENGQISRIVGDEKVLIIGIHNLYYADFNFVLPEWPQASKARFILARDWVPQPDKRIKKIYENEKTNVALYKL